ncbi:hypothetical protein EB796_023938 [Bugula neritina]|uniref:Uncharacterized protein n=1 Tax=Bugula neritina TaxID=10212 RepID=A0A7J7IW05_BUGNE|nr:hypothetical protein EB796_023938 [Bugula neritina]
MLRQTLLLACVAAVSSHICLLNPHQRGSMEGINKFGAKDCMLRTGPCGGRPADDPPSLKLISGTNYTVTFQQNVNHLDPNSPGYFAVSIGDDMDSLVEAARIPDRGAPNFTIFQVPILVPLEGASLTHVIQVKYVTNNPSIPVPLGTYYQCGDILINDP